MSLLPEPSMTYGRYKVRLGRGLLLWLEILIAADVIRTVVLEPTLSNASVLALLVVLRTFLSWSLLVEIGARWPWQPKREHLGYSKTGCVKAQLRGSGSVVSMPTPRSLRFRTSAVQGKGLSPSRSISRR